MEQEWNDDERDTRSLTRSITCKSNINTDRKSICDVMREYYKDQKESLYTWSTDDYNKELKRRVNQNLQHTLAFKSKTKDSEFKTELDNSVVDEQPVEQEEEVNTEIMENEIYKKSLYS
jgi:hypothetical protein